MPNWCYNYLQITGSKENIRKITDILEVEISKKEAGKMFEPLVGIQPDLTREEYDNGGWYNANINYWGCKWDVTPWEFDPALDDTSIVMSFDTAWSPAEGFAELLTKKYGVSTRLEFHEGGNYFAGYQTTGPDEETNYQSWDYMEGLYHTDPEQFWHEFGTKVWDSFDDGEPLEIEDLLEEDEYAFFDEEDKANARRHYEIQKADVLKYLEENGTLEERLEEIRQRQQQD
jgi:hypothetical protein